MSILSGYGKFKRYVLTDSGYQLCSQWTSSNTVHFDDGNTAQTKVGAINGITDSLTATNSNIALSAKAGKSLQDQVTSLNTGLVGMANVVCINVPEDTNSFNSAIYNRIYYVTEPKASVMTVSPNGADTLGGFLVNLFVSGTENRAQIYIERGTHANTNQGKIYYRIKWTYTWNEWKILG